MNSESEQSAVGDSSAGVATPALPKEAGAGVAGEAGPSPRSRRSLFRLWPAAILVALLGVIGWLLANHDLAADWLLLRGYHVPASIQQMADADAMTPYARRLFYVNKPVVQQRDEFNKNCTTKFDKVSVLGCYTGDRRGIYIYNVTDVRLSGIKQVTAAHEMLHQAYDRLNSRERARVDALLEAYAKTVTDPELLSKISAYKKSEPHDLVNEYHSVFGTEVRHLPQPLEDYYARYFTNRGKVIALHTSYQEAFTERTNRIAAYDLQLDALKKQIDTDKSTITGLESALRTQRAQLDSYLAESKVKEYNAAVPGFNAQVAQYKDAVAAANARIVSYNSLIDARNSIAVEEQQLQRALDSHTSPASQQ